MRQWLRRLFTPKPWSERSRREKIFSCLLVIVWVSFGYLYVRDDPPAYDADLIPVVTPIPDSQNAYSIVMRSAAASRLNSSERYTIIRQLDGSISSATVVQGYVARSTETLALFSELSRRSAMQEPDSAVPSFPGSGPVPSYMDVYSAARLSLVRADVLARQGRIAEALAICLTVVDVGRIFAKGPKLLDSLAGMGLIDLGAARALRFVRADGIDRGRLLAAARRLSVKSGAAEGLQSGFRYRYRDAAYLHDHEAEFFERRHPNPTPLQRLAITLTKSGLTESRPHRWNAWEAAAARLLIAAAPKACTTAGLTTAGWPPPGLRSHRIAEFLAGFTFSGSEDFFRRRCTTDFRLSAAAVAAAAQAYRSDRGRFPDRLDDLAPRYVPAVPIDPFNGAAPIYSHHDGSIHSVAKIADDAAD
jgi:hypothetical protein